MQGILKEVIKIYQPNAIEDNDEIKNIIFTGGEGVNDSHGHNLTLSPFSNDSSGRCSSDYWVAVNKKILAENYESVCIASLNNDRRHWKKTYNWQINDLLNSADINSSRETLREETEQPRNSEQPSPIPPSSTIQFTIGKVQTLEPELGWFWVEPNPSVTVNGVEITHISLVKGELNTHFQDGNLAVGNVVCINGIEFGPEKTCIVNGNELMINGNFSGLQLVSRQQGETSPPENPIFAEVRQKNEELPNQENAMSFLARELLGVIEANRGVCQEARKIRLNLPEIPADVLEYFQEEFFAKLDEKFPLDSSVNREIIANNQVIREKKLTIEQNIYRISNDNRRKLLEGRNGEETPDSENELKKIRDQVKEEINKILISKSSLQNIDLKTLLINGKYRNWEEEIEQLPTREEILVYRDSFLKDLKRVGVGNNKNDIVNAPSLRAARNIAERIIRETFKKHNVEPANLKKLWIGSRTWWEHLEKLDRKERIDQFVKTLEREISQMNNQTPFHQSKPLNTLLLSTIFGLFFLVVIGLAIRIVRKKRTNYN